MPEHAPGPLAFVPPTIKGIFVNSHIKAVERACGAEGRERLELLVGQPLSFGAAEDVPVALEVRILEAAVELLVKEPVAADDVAYEAGRLHYRNFKGTPWATVLFGMLPRDFRFMILHSPAIAERVFKGVTFESEELAPTTVKMAMGNADYPMEHFKGFLGQWMADFGLKGTVVGQATGPRRYEYLMQW
ncbi:MAG: hypothetical protein QOD77_2046 [Thermoplasmata archaeon]|jgi:uncharacterized protein (TIGR02265 family)|nr:hypothetical protein [Thermoplasmata archaeon]